jgi:hypothetical protein
MKRKSLRVALLVVAGCALSLFIFSLASPYIPISRTYASEPVSADKFPGVAVEKGSYKLRAIYTLPGEKKDGKAVFSLPKGSFKLVELKFEPGTVEFNGSPVDFHGLEDDFMTQAREAVVNGSVDLQGYDLPLEEGVDYSTCAAVLDYQSAQISFVGRKEDKMNLLAGFSLSNPVMRMPGEHMETGQAAPNLPAGVASSFAASPGAAHAPITAPARLTNFKTTYKQLGNLASAKSLTFVVTSSTTKLVDPLNVTVESTGTFVIKAEQ